MKNVLLKNARTEHFGDDHESYYLFCKGCNHLHQITVKWGAKSGRKEPQWTFNGDMIKPTFNPSLLVTFQIDRTKEICHSWIKDGKIQYLSDCTHALAGQTIDLEEVTVK